MSSSIKKEEEGEKGNSPEKIIQKWLTLQKIIKEEITLEEMIIGQQKLDFENLKNKYKEYYKIKLQIRNGLDDITKLDNNHYENNKELKFDDNIERALLNIYEEIKNLLIIFRNDFNYISKLVSLIEEEEDDQNSVDSLAQLFCNQFYDNILISNPEQDELLLLTYKLLWDEIAPMNCAFIDNFLDDNTFLGKFCTAYINKPEFKSYLTLLLNPLILSIENENNDCLDMSVVSIKQYLSTKNKDDKNNYEDDKNEVDLNKILISNIPKTKVVFKKNSLFETQIGKDKVENINKIQKEKNNIIQESNFNNEYQEDLTYEKLQKIISHEKNQNIKEFLIYQLEQITDDMDTFSNRGFLNVLQDNNFRNCKKELAEKYKSNFLFIQNKIDTLLQNLIDKMTTIPYIIRCICKIIFILINKKFPLLPKYLKNSFIGKFILGKYIFPALGLENKTIMDPRIFSNSTKNCLSEIISVLNFANKCMLFNNIVDSEKTIFNYYLMEIIPILNKFYEKLIDVKLPKILDDYISNEKLDIDEYFSDTLYQFDKESKKNEQNIIVKKENSQNKIYDYFKENKDEIFQLKCICFSIQDILFITNLINKNIKVFNGLDNFDFFSKTFQRIHSNEYKLDNEINKEPKAIKFFIIFQDKKNSQLESLIRRNEKIDSTFLPEKEESQLICKRIKLCIKKIFRGLNIIDEKDFSSLNMATSSDKFLVALNCILEDLSELSELKKQIPLKWYGQYILNNKEQLSQLYKKDDFDLLYKEIFKEESNILNELKLFTSIIIARDGMNIKCAEKNIEKVKFDFKTVQNAKKFMKIEKFVHSEEIEICIKLRDTEDKAKNKSNKKKNKDEKGAIIPAIIITDGEKCEHKITENLTNKNDKTEKNEKKEENAEHKSTNKKIPSHCYNIKEFIQKFAEKQDPKDKNNKNKTLAKLVKDDITTGDRGNYIFKSISNYMDIIKNKIKNSKKNKQLFENITEKEIEEMSEKIEDYVVRKIYKYVYIDTPLPDDVTFYEKTLSLDWITPEILDIKKVYVNQLSLAEKYIRKLDEAKSVSDKLNCIKNAHTNMNNTIKFSSGKNEDAGQDELTPILQYIVIKAQPKRIHSDINYIRCFLNESCMRGQEGFLVTQMELATSFIMTIDHSVLKMDEKEFNRLVSESKKKYGLK